MRHSDDIMGPWRVVLTLGCVLWASSTVCACGGGDSDDGGTSVDGSLANDAETATDGSSGSDGQVDGQVDGPVDGSNDRVDACNPGVPGPWVNMLSFDEYPDATVIATEYAGLGVVFESASAQGAPSISTMFSSPVSAPGYLSGEYEGDEDLNPGLEYGNNQPALAITARFVDPADGNTPAVTNSVSLQEVYSNTDNVTRIEAFDSTNTLVDSDEVVADAVTPGQQLSVAGDDIHYIVVTFGAPGSNGLFEDSAGIDELTFAQPAVACP